MDMTHLLSSYTLDTHTTFALAESFTANPNVIASSNKHIFTFGIEGHRQEYTLSGIMPGLLNPTEVLLS